MRALVTGASGFIGSHLVRRLANDGAEVHALVRPTSRLSDLPASCAVHVIDGEDMGALAAIIDRAAPDVTFHLAAFVRADHGPDDIVPMLRANLSFGTLLAEALTSRNFNRLVNTGTPWQHFGNAEYEPACLYAATKQAFEDVLAFYGHARGLRIVTLLPADNYGAGDRRNKLLGLLVQALQSGERLDLSPGEQTLDIVHVDDVVEAYVAAARRLLDGQVASSERWAVTSGAGIAMRDLVALVERLAGRPLRVNWGARPYRPREVMTPCRHEAPFPGWTPRWDLERGLRDLLARNGLAAPGTAP